MTKAIVLQLGLRRFLSCLCTQMLHLLRSPLGTKLLNARALVCPEELAKADMRPFREGFGF